MISLCSRNEIQTFSNFKNRVAGFNQDNENFVANLYSFADTKKNTFYTKVTTAIEDYLFSVLLPGFFGANCALKLLRNNQENIYCSEILIGDEVE